MEGMIEVELVEASPSIVGDLMCRGLSKMKHATRTVPVPRVWIIDDLHTSEPQESPNKPTDTNASTTQATRLLNHLAGTN